MTINRDTMLRVIIFTDFVLVSMVLTADWLPKTYLLNQAAILALGFGAIVNRGSVLQVELLMLIKFLSIIIDAIVIGMYFQLGNHTFAVLLHRSYFVFSAFCAILLLILKPIMLLLLNKVRQDRLNDAAYDAYTPSGYMPVDGQ